MLEKTEFCIEKKSTLYHTASASWKHSSEHTMATQGGETGGGKWHLCEKLHSAIHVLRRINKS